MDLNPIVAALLAAAGVTACAQAQDPAVAPAAPTSSADAAAAVVAPVSNIAAASDAEVLGLLMAASEHQTKLAQMARNKGVSAPVIEYADMIRVDHAADLQRVIALANEAGHASYQTPSVLSKQAHAESERATLGGKSGAEFEAAWIGATVAEHLRLLDMIDTQLLPAVRREEVQAHLRAMRAHVVAHLEKGRTLVGAAPVTTQ